MLARTPPDRQFEFDLVAALPLLRNQLRKLCSGETWRIDDLVQHACLQALLYHGQFERGTNIGGWLFVIAQNKFYQDHRHMARREVEDVDGRFAGAVEMAPPQDARLEALDTLSLIGSLPAGYGATLTMYGVGFDYREIAAACGVADGTIKSRLHRAKRMLRRTIEHVGAVQC